MPKCDTSPTDRIRLSCGLSPATRAWVGGHNSHAKCALEEHLCGTQRPPTGPIDVAFVVPASVNEAVYFTRKLSARLDKDAAIWMVLAALRKGGAANTDLPKLAEVRDAMYAAGFVSVVTVTLDETWEATRFDSKALPIST